MHFATQNLFGEAAEIIETAENDLRGILSKAVENGDYDAIVKITACAKELRNLLDKVTGEAEIAKLSDEPGDEIGPEATSYPRFFRRGNRLVMVGWSKKHSTEYKHESPRIVLDLLVSELRRACSERETVRYDESLRLVNPENGAPFPDYYARTVLRWLVTLGLVTKHGHQGYSLEKSEKIESTIATKWKQLEAI